MKILVDFREERIKMNRRRQRAGRWAVIQIIKMAEVFEQMEVELIDAAKH